jgi:hypothetical protein
MKETRKMVLVDFDKYKKFEKPEHELDTAPKPLYGLHNDMNSILNDEKLSDYEKQNLYLQQLNRFLLMNQPSRKRRENELIDEQEFEKFKNELLTKSNIKKESMKYVPNVSMSEDSDDEFKSIGGNSIERTLQRVVEIDPYIKYKPQSTPVVNTQKSASNSLNKSEQKFGSPSEMYHRLRSRTVSKTKPKSNRKPSWTSYENMQNSFD